ncbi:hypothetical protein [Pseudidiomarina sp. CB1]
MNYRRHRVISSCWWTLI